MNTPLRLALLGVALAAASLRMTADPAGDPMKPAWKAVWITCPGVDVRAPGVYRFRRSFRIQAVPEHLWVRVSADNRYVLSVNGVSVGSGPSRADLDHWRYEAYDIAPRLKVGANVIGATVWNYGSLAPVGQFGDQTAFILDAEGEAAELDTGPGWEAKPEPGQGFMRVDAREVPGYYAASPGERVDGSRYDWTWLSSATGWKGATDACEGEPGRFPAPIHLGTGTGINRWVLVPDPLPPMEGTEIAAGAIVRVEGTREAARFPLVVPPHSRVSVLVDRGAMTTGFAEVRTSGGAGASLRVTYAEALVDNLGNKGQRGEVAGRHIVGLSDLFLPDGGADRAWTTLGWRSWRFLQLDVETASDPVTVTRLSASFSGFPFQERASVRASDPAVARIWETGVRTARLNAHETYSDCPYWEQLQYIGDTRLQALISYTCFGDDRLAVQALDAYDASRSPEGLTQSRYPSTLPQYIPPFSLLWVGMLHDYWMYRPDPGRLAAWVAHTRGVIDWHLSRLRPDMLLGSPPWWNFVDWTHDFTWGVPPQDPEGGSASLSLGLASALRDGAELEEHFGDAQRAAEYRRKAAQITAAVFRLCWDPARGLLADTPARNHFSEQANTLGVLTGAVPREHMAPVMKTVLAHGRGLRNPVPTGEFSPASIYFRFYVARAMDRAGLADLYMGTLGPWRDMLALGLTTWAETAEPTRSDDHAWSAHPNYDLLTLVAGIRPASPGFASVVIEPHPGPLTSLDARMPHPDGDIVVHYALAGRRWTFEVTLPKGLPGMFVWNNKQTALSEGRNRIEAAAE